MNKKLKHAIIYIIDNLENPSLDLVWAVINDAQNNINNGTYTKEVIDNAIENVKDYENYFDLSQSNIEWYGLL